MEIYIFKCSNQTQDECLRKNLFGARGSWVNEVEVDSVCLLYNFQSEIIYGIWRTTGAKGVLEENAFDGRFPNQVKVQLDSERGIVQAAKEKVEKLTQRKFTASSPFKVELAESALKSLFESVSQVEPQITLPISALEEDFRQRYPREFHCDDGHDVRSQGETMIDNWLFKNNICHGYEVLMDVPERIFPDFLVYDLDRQPVYIEYWGKEGDKDYVKRKERKKEIYSKYSVKLVEINQDATKNLDHVMRAKLRAANVIK